MKLIGISAPSGSGKSTFVNYVLDYLPQALSIDLDELLVKNMNSKLNTILELYGSNAIRKDGSFNIGYLIEDAKKMKKAGILYYDDVLRKKSFKDIFPNINNEFVFLQLYYLNEIPIWDDCDLQIVINTTFEERLRHLKLRSSKSTEQQFKLRANYGDITKLGYDVEIFNNYNERDLKKSAEKLVNMLLSNFPLKRVAFKFPGRVQMCPLNFEDFDFAKPSLVGGGGYGFAVKLNNTFEAHYVIGSNDVIECNKSSKKILIEHLLKTMKVPSSLNVSVTISLDEQLGEHSGLGSNSSLISACICGFNALLNNKSKKELIQIIKDNYYETSNGQLVKGLTTGVSFHSFFEGGFVVVGNKGKLIYHNSFDSNKLKCYLINPKIKRDTKDIEDINQLENSRLLDKSYKYERAYEFLMEVIPDVNDGSLKMLAKYNYKNHLNGGQKAVIESYPNKGEEILRILSLFNDSKYVVGLSSCGPRIYLLTEYSEDALGILEQNNLDYTQIYIENESVYTNLNNIKYKNIDKS